MNEMKNIVLISAFCIFGLAGCVGTVGGNQGYLEPTEKNLSFEQKQRGLSKLIFLRPEVKDGTVPTIFVNDQVVGSLAPNRYAQTWVCSGTQTIRVGSRAGNTP